MANVVTYLKTIGIDPHHIRGKMEISMEGAVLHSHDFMGEQHLKVIQSNRDKECVLMAKRAAQLWQLAHLHTKRRRNLIIQKSLSIHKLVDVPFSCKSAR